MHTSRHSLTAAVQHVQAPGALSCARQPGERTMNGLPVDERQAPLGRPGRTVGLGQAVAVSRGTGPLVARIGERQDQVCLTLQGCGVFGQAFMPVGGKAKNV